MTLDALTLTSVSAGYGDLVVVRDVSFTVPDAGITVLLGRNGAGKSTLLRTIAGLNAAVTGDILLAGRSVVHDPPYRRRSRGIGFVQENKRIFKRRTVEQNLRLATRGLGLKGPESKLRMDEAYNRFPILAEKRRQTAGYLSGGQQQMLAISQALISHPHVLLLDEPFAGLAPSVVNDVMDSIRRVRSDEGRTVLLVEQTVDLAISLADVVLVLNVGRLVHTGLPTDPSISEIVESSYFGTGSLGRDSASTSAPTAVRSRSEQGTMP
jgi:branched-chain amino acid transport system ATP-binding protein